MHFHITFDEFVDNGRETVFVPWCNLPHMALVVSLLAVGAAVFVVVGGIALYRRAGDDGQDIVSDSNPSTGATVSSDDPTPSYGSDDSSDDPTPSYGSDDSSDGGRSATDVSPSDGSTPNYEDNGRSSLSTSESEPISDATSSNGDDETAVADEYLDGSRPDDETAVADEYLDGSDGETGGSTHRTKTCPACGTGIEPTAAVCPSCEAIIWSDCDVLLDGDGMAVDLDCGSSVGPAIRRALSRSGVSNDGARRVSTEHLAFRTRGSRIEVRNCTTTASALELDGRALEPDEWTPVSDGQRLTVAGRYDFTVRIPE